VNIKACFPEATSSGLAPDWVPGKQNRIGHCQIRPTLPLKKPQLALPNSKCY
jgi:hypothetical protein